MTDIVRQAIRSLEQGCDVIFPVIIGKAGSTPRQVGTRMLVFDGGTSGSIGGGRFEKQVIERALDLFKSEVSEIAQFTEGDDTCGGLIEVLFEYVKSSAENVVLLERLLKLKRDGKKGWLVISVSGSQAVREFVVAGEDMPALPDAVLQLCDSHDPGVLKIGSEVFFVEPIEPSRRVWLVGSGHIGKALCNLALRLGYDVTVFDDRIECLQHPDLAHAHHVLYGSVDTCLLHDDLPEPEIIMTMTRTHGSDGMVLAQALKTKASYIGMIGSRKKREALLTNLGKAGFADNELQRIRCPAGLDIGAQTPEEIAVSVAAEWILERRGRKR